MPDPDLITVTVAEAHLLGGPEFVAEVRDDGSPGPRCGGRGRR
jgi:hypothetical protein